MTLRCNTEHRTTLPENNGASVHLGNAIKRLQHQSRMHPRKVHEYTAHTTTSVH
jgi:hypothetical protein